MPERELQSSSVPLLTIGGVNQRVNKRELEDYEYSWLSGAAPVYSGAQTRLWGKSQLAQFSSPILGIYQAWTPMGYGLGLYQFNGTLDAGIWQSPLTGIVLPPLGADLLFDLAGYTYDEFGYSVGGSFGYGPINACLLSFIDGDAAHTACGAPAEGGGNIDTTSNGPAGHGQKCKFTQVVTDYDISNFATLQKQSSGSYNDITVLDNVGTPPVCVLGPTLPIPLGPLSPYGTFVNVSPINNSFSATQSLVSLCIFTNNPTNPLCNFKATNGPQGSATDTIFNLDFSSLVLPGLPIPTNVTLLATTNPGGTGEIPLGVNFAQDGTGNYNNLNIQASNFIPVGIPALNSSDGFTSNASITAGTIRVYTYKRVCTPNA
jgi:hypothetical protein